MERMKLKTRYNTYLVAVAARVGEVAATAHGEVAASRSILDVAKCAIFIYIIC